VESGAFQGLANAGAAREAKRSAERRRRMGKPPVRRRMCSGGNVKEKGGER
jgi:hypothetical protein